MEGGSHFEPTEDNPKGMQIEKPQGAQSESLDKKADNWKTTSMQCTCWNLKAISVEENDTRPK